MSDLRRLARKMCKGQYTLRELGITAQDIRQLRRSGYQVIAQNTPRGRIYHVEVATGVVAHYISGASKEPQSVSWVELSDLHAGSYQFDEKGLRCILKRAVDEGYKDVHISGDLTDGFGVYRGQLQNLKYWNCQDQADLVVNILADYDLDYYAIKGNHDVSFEKTGSPSPLQMVETSMAQEGKKFVFLDGMAADLVICGVLKRMVHLDGGNSYAKSYPGQTYIRNLLDSAGDSVNIGGNNYRIALLQFGHFHTSIEYEAAGIVCTHPGNFQLPNDFTTRRGLVGTQGGRFTSCIIEDKQIIEHRSTFIKPSRK